MIVLDETPFERDQYGYHITNIDSMDGIREKGLIPQIGERSKFIGETEESVFFICNLYDVREWINAIYYKRNIEELELLRFNIKGLEFHVRGGYSIHEPQEFYITHSVSPEEIEYARVFNSKTNEPLTLDTQCNDMNVVWNKLDGYKPLKFVPPRV